jgi:tRNA pseudouridine38-40 synthase
MSDGEIAVSDHGDPSLDAFVAAESLTRVRLDVAYDGTQFSGWAAQPARRTVQAVLQEALATVLRLPGVELTVAGRTDAGVHATGQVAHADLPAAAWQAEGDRLVRRLAGVLPGDVRVAAATPAPPGFDARFSAVWRRYEYRICDAEAGVPPLRRHVVLAWRRRLDETAMAQAAAGLLGLRDFAAFCKRRDTGTTVRTLQRLDVAREQAGAQAGEIVCRVQADAFCHSMVRSLVGALLAVGEGRRPVDWPATLLGRSSRADDVGVAPAHGLTLLEVGYPADAELAARAEQTRARRA